MGGGQAPWAKSKFTQCIQWSEPSGKIRAYMLHLYRKTALGNDHCVHGVFFPSFILRSYNGVTHVPAGYVNTVC